MRRLAQSMPADRRRLGALPQRIVYDRHAFSAQRIFHAVAYGRSRANASPHRVRVFRKDDPFMSDQETRPVPIAPPITIPTLPTILRATTPTEEVPLPT